jgi:DNA-binding winged helix-turn-helix (wHTH) protein
MTASGEPRCRLARFGVFEVDLETGELRKKGLRVALQEQPFRVLAMLLERPGELVTRDQLRARLWPDAVFVDFDHGVNKAVAKIRRALGDLAESPRYVETLERRGYRFVAPVESVSAACAAAAATTIVARLVSGDRAIPIAGGEHIVGRDPGCPLWIDSSFVSRRHARLIVAPGAVMLEDLGSRNGTFLNGERISGRRTLSQGDEIRVGPATFVLHLATEVDPTRTAPR